jgi:uncharacterized protein YbdZ (MbtH family)
VDKNPIDNERGSYFVLIDDGGRHCLCPAFAEVPAWWRMIFGGADRAVCLDHIEVIWTDVRPRTARKRLANVIRS